MIGDKADFVHSDVPRTVPRHEDGLLSAESWIGASALCADSVQNTRA